MHTSCEKGGGVQKNEKRNLYGKLSWYNEDGKSLTK